MRTVSDHIALLQDDVDPENATEEEALLLENGRSFRFCCPWKTKPRYYSWRGNAINYCIFITVLARISSCTIASLIDFTVLTRHGEFSACGRSIFIYRAAGIFARCSCKGNTSGIFLISTAHASVKRGYLFSEPGGNSTASIVGFGPVKRDAEKCTTGTTRHAWIQIAHNSPVQL